MGNLIDAYQAFLRSKVVMADSIGFDIDDEDINPILKLFQRACIRWAVRMGRAALFESFGLGKTLQQIEIVRLILEQLLGATGENGMGLIVIPLGVRQEFLRDAIMLATGDHPAITDEQRAELKRWQAGRPDRIPTLKFIRRIEECDGPGIYLTNYETVRDGKLDPQHFIVASLDEAAILRGFGGTKTFREFMATFAGDRKTMNDRVLTEGVKYRFVATATPSPNEYIELLAYSAFLGVMDIGNAKTRFFKRNSEKADQLTLHPHKEREFWMWVSSWGLFVQKPSDLGFSDEGYELPEMEILWHEIPADHTDAGFDFRGQGQLIKQQAIGVVDSAREKRESLPARIAKMMEIRAIDLDAHRIIWHDLEAERMAIEKAIPDVMSVFGSQDDDTKAARIIGFSEGDYRELAGKPVMLGSGCNFQRHCAWAIFLGIGFKFADFIQAVHRLHRFLQQKTVRIDLIYTEQEREVRRILEQKWQQHKDTVEQMTAIIKEFGLSSAAMADNLKRAMGVERIEVIGRNFRAINNDCVLEAANLPDNSIDLGLTSIPFATQYEYSPNYADFGHSDNNAHFFEQMDFLTPNLLRILKPGRIFAIHVKDRIVPGGMTGLGFQTVYPFHARCIDHYTKHGFGYLGMKTIVTDVVRENNQTYRLGWSEQCKDGTKMGVGMPEYLLLFRKPPTDTSNSYADDPVTKGKPDCTDAAGNVIPWVRGGNEVIGTGYSRARWQVDAHGFARSSGNRLLTPDELETLDHDIIFRWFRDYNLHNIYDFEHHVRIGETMDSFHRLPTTFMLLQPPSWMNDVWTDIARMRTLNMIQAQKGQEQHLCPLQFDIIDRVIEQFSMAGETVFDPFGGILSIPYRAIKKKRKAIACELSSRYFMDGVQYCQAAEREMSMPSLFSVFDDMEAA